MKLGDFRRWGNMSSVFFGSLNDAGAVTFRTQLPPALGFDVPASAAGGTYFHTHVTPPRKAAAPMQMPRRKGNGPLDLFPAHGERSRLTPDSHGGSTG